MRISQLAVIEGAAKSGPWRLLLLLCVGVDVAVWWALRDPDRLGLKLRLVLDSADIAVWSLGSYSPPERYFLAVFVAAPFAIDVGMRRPRLALVVPTVTFVVTTAVRLLAGRPFVPLPFAWLILAAAAGVFLSRYDYRLRRQAEEEWSRRRSAEDRRAYLAGQNAVAMGASSVVDGIEGVLPILGVPEPGSALWRLADGWKTGLGASTRRVWMYLGDALLEWQRDHNRHPDLRSRVALTPGEGTGTTLLTGSQVLALRRALADLPAPASYAVALDDPSVPLRPPGGAFDLRIGDRTVRVPARRRGPVRAYDPGPLLFALLGLLSVADLLFMHVHLLPALGSLGLFFGAAWWSHHRIRRLGQEARPAILVLAVAVAMTVAAMITVTARSPEGPNGASFPIVPGLDLLAIMACMYRSTLSRRVLGVVAVGALCVPGLAWLLHPGSRPLANLVQYLVWPICAFTCAWRYSRELETAVRHHADDVAVDDDMALTQAFLAGRLNVLNLTGQAVEDAARRLGELRSTVGPTLYEHVEQKLREVERRLQALLRLDDVSPSLTTTPSLSTAMPPR